MYYTESGPLGRRIAERQNERLSEAIAGLDDRRDPEPLSPWARRALSSKLPPKTALAVVQQERDDS